MSQTAPGGDNSPLNSIVTSDGGNDTTVNNNNFNAKLKLLDEERNGTDGAAMSAVEDFVPDPMSQIPGAPTGFNVYRNKKTLTQGMMDIALFSANANQFRYVLENGNQSMASFYVAVILISLSLILQIAVGLILLRSVQYNVTIQCQKKICYKYGNYASAGIFLITVVNVFIVAFGNVSPNGVLLSASNSSLSS